MIFFFLFPAIIFIINFFIKKNKLFLNNYQLDHQKLTNNQASLIGGYFLIIPIIFFFENNYIFFSIVFVLIFLLGIFSDLNILSSPKKRFLLQFILILTFVFANKIEVFPTRIDFIDEQLSRTVWSYFFTVFCLMILLNGSNFIDGLNGLLLGYILIIFFIVLKLDLLSNFNVSEENLYLIVYALLIIYIFNLFNQFFLGDSGAYSLSFLIGFMLIEIYSKNLFISPYFIVLLLWYPCFENFFSILRKLSKKKSVLKPDNQHLHQLIFIFLKKKNKMNNLTVNIISGLLINFFNLILLYVGSLDPYNTKFQLNLLLVAILLYVVTYISMNNHLKKI
jgi:UDP-N-acetylmuramyl pentapeptide phosphotransferase/UDP-N-acetylglucosamine-1-phosphate transferase